MEATEVQKFIDRLREQNLDRHTPGSTESLEALARAVVEEGEWMPEDTQLTAELGLTFQERISGTREQDMTAMVLAGMMLGSALERDVPTGSEAEDEWRAGNFTLPEGDE
jgi:hypothetical protein